MASSAFGFAKAVETLPNYFEFGKSLVGQGKEDLALEQKNKELAARFGLAAQEQADLADYRASEMAQKARDAEDLARYRTGTLDAENRVTNQVRIPQVKVQQGELGLKAQELPSKIQQNYAQSRYLDSGTKLHGSQADAQEIENQLQRDYANDIHYRELYQLNPNDPTIPEDKRREFDTLFPTVLNPHAPAALKLITDRQEAMKRGDAYTPPTEEENAVIGRGIQPWLDMGGEGQQFLRFEPTSDGQRVRVRIKNADGKEVYMTHNRMPNAQGGVDDEFSRQELSDVMGIVRDSATFQLQHPEFRQQWIDRKEAGSFENYHKIQLEKMRDAARSQGKTQSMADENFVKSWQNDFDKQLSANIDLMTGVSAAKKFAEENGSAFDDSAYQVEKQKLMSELRDAVRSHAKTPEDLLKFKSGDLLGGVQTRIRDLKGTLSPSGSSASGPRNAGSTFNN